MSWSDVPKDVVRLWLKNYVPAADYPNLLLSSRLFHVLTAKDRSAKYRQLLVERAERKDFHQRARKQFAYKNLQTDKDLDENLRPCIYCPAIVKEQNYERHLKKCRAKPGILDYQGRPWNSAVIAVELKQVRCQGLKCPFTTQQWDMWRHVSQCPLQKIRCDGCGEEKTRQEMCDERHQWFECWNRPGFECALGCGQKRIDLSRAEWVRHKKECAVEELECPLCHRMVQRQFLQYHCLKQQPPALDNMGFTGIFIWKLDETKQIATCANRHNGPWYRRPDQAWGREKSDARKL